MMTTGAAARLLGISREQLLQDLLTLNLSPLRDRLGRRRLTQADLQRLMHLRAERRRRAALRRAPYR